MSVAQGVGDVDGDGVTDHLVSAYSLKRPSVATPTFFGRVYLFSGRTGDVLARIDQPAPGASAFFGLQDLAPNTPGDVTGDGVPDLYVSAFNQPGASGQSGAGRAWVFDGAATLAAGQGVVEYELIDPALGPSRGFGFTASCTDYNKDGTPDLYVSNLQSQNTETYVFEGRTGSLLKTLGLPPGVAQAPSTGNAGSGLGESSRAPGDLNGDGEPDYVATAHTQDVGGTQTRASSSSSSPTFRGRRPSPNRRAKPSRRVCRRVLVRAVSRVGWGISTRPSCECRGRGCCVRIVSWMCWRRSPRGRAVLRWTWSSMPMTAGTRSRRR